MPQEGLQEYLNKLDPLEIVRVTQKVPRDGFMSSFVLALEEKGRYPVVMMENVEGSGMPVICNVFACRERVANIAGATAGEFYLKWNNAQQNMMQPLMVQDGPVREIIYTGDEVDVTSLPISVHFASDAGRYISSGIAAARDPDTGVYNLSYHRMQLRDRNHFGISLHSRGHLWDYFRRASLKGQDLEIAVIVGCHPAVYLAASSKIGIMKDEYQLAGALLGEPLELVPCATVELAVPSSAELVLEGKILANTFEDEGPFGEYTGYSTSRSTRNVMEVSAVMRRKECIFMDLVPGYSNEHLLLGGAAKEAENLFLIKERFPFVEDIYLPKSGTHFHAYIKMKKTMEGQPRQVMTTLTGLDMYLKLIVAVDEDVDIYDEQQVLWAMATRMQPFEDIMILNGLPCNALDPSSKDGMSSKMLIDATAPLRQRTPRCEESSEMRALARRIMDEL